MKDTAYRAFLKYARLGLHKKNMSSFDAAARISGCTSNRKEAISLLAVYDTLRILHAEGKYEYADAVRYVYFSGGGRARRKNDTILAIRRFAYSHHLDDRTVWRKIEYAMKLYYSLVEEQLLCP